MKSENNSTEFTLYSIRRYAYCDYAKQEYDSNIIILS